MEGVYSTVGAEVAEGEQRNHLALTLSPAQREAIITSRRHCADYRKGRGGYPES